MFQIIRKFLDILKRIEVIACSEARNKIRKMHEQLLVRRNHQFVFQQKIVIDFWFSFCKSLYCYLLRKQLN